MQSLWYAAVAVEVLPLDGWGKLGGVAAVAPRGTCGGGLGVMCVAPLFRGEDGDFFEERDEV